MTSHHPRNPRQLIFFFLVIAAIVSGTALAAGQVLINEVMSANASTVSDDDGDFPDWIELYNSSGQAVSLEGYVLTDDPDDLSKWSFPDISIQAGGHVLVYASDKDRWQLASTWESVITLNDEWKYTTNTASVPANWRESGFDDSGWDIGASGIGTNPSHTMGGTTITTQSSSFYMRKTFTIDDMDNIRAVMLSMDFADGFVAYINGQEVARANVGTPGEPPEYDERVAVYSLPVYFQGSTPPAYEIDSFADILTIGENILAVQIHKSFWGQLFGMPFLSFALAEFPAEPRGVPAQLGFEDKAQEFHTNFKISASEETLLLVNASGVVVDSITVTNQENDISIGRSPDGAADWYLFDTPTPGVANGEGYLGFSEAVAEASLPNGFYSNSQSVTLTSDAPGGTIRYTTDGSLPDENATDYLAPVTIDTTTVIRAAVFEDGYLPGPVLTKTYIIDEASTIPVVSLTFDPPDLWDDDTGMYVIGNSTARGGYPDAPVTEGNTNAAPNYGGANFFEDWEKPVHVEFFEPNGTLGFEADAGAKIHGKQNRRLPQKSWSIHFRDEYGLDELDYPLFPGNGLTEFKSFILRNAGHDWESAMCRDVYLQEILEPLDLESQDTRTSHVYINGVYWGMMHLREKLNEDYLQRHKNADADAVDIIDDYHARFLDAGIYQAHPFTEDATTWTCYVSEGTADHYNNLLEYMVGHDETDAEVYAYLKTQIDIENFVDYMLSRIFVADPDGPGHNTKLWRPQTPDGRWRWLVYDLDYGAALQQDPFGWPGPAYLSNMLEYYLQEEQSQRSPDANFLLYSLIENETFKAFFANRYADLLNTVLRQDVITTRLAEIKAIMEPEIERHIQRWKDYDSFLGFGPLTSKSMWLDNMAVIEEFAELRTAHTRSNFIESLNLGGEATLTVNNNQPGSGTIRLNTLDLTDATFTGIYFTGVPVNVTAVPKPGWRFAGWSGASTETASSITLDLAGTTTITASFVEDIAATNTIIFNEICYNPSDDKDSRDWVELYSSYAEPVDLGNWVFKDSEEVHTFTIPAGTVIQPGGYLVLCREMEYFAAAFPQVDNVVGSFGFGISSTGDQLRLFDSTGALIDSLTFSVDTPWPSEPNGNGPTLELKSTSMDNTLPESWEASAGYGTPGSENGQVVAVDESDFQVPAAFRLGSNYPNPFNPVTTIPFDLPSAGHVRIEVYNAIGQRIAVPIDGRMDAGYHSLVFDAADLPSGFLFYRMQAGTFTSSGKMLLLK